MFRSASHNIRSVHLSLQRLIIAFKVSYMSLLELLYLILSLTSSVTIGLMNIQYRLIIYYSVLFQKKGIRCPKAKSKRCISYHFIFYRCLKQRRMGPSQRWSWQLYWRQLWEWLTSVCHICLPPLMLKTQGRSHLVREQKFKSTPSLVIVPSKYFLVQILF